jgi:hypothetical protein
MIIDLETWIRSQLLGSEDLEEIVGERIYADQAPQGAQRPFVVYQMLSAVDDNTGDARRDLTTCIYQVKVVDDGEDKLLAAQAAELVDDTLHDKSDTQGGIVIDCVREEMINLPVFDRETARHYRQVGGLYRIWIR